mgnify:CR=1 FL=1
MVPAALTRPLILVELRPRSLIQNRDQTYTLSSLARVLEGDYTLTAWYDKPENEGGRVRVIVKENAFGSGVSADAVVQEAQRVARGYFPLITGAPPP